MSSLQSTNVPGDGQPNQWKSPWAFKNQCSVIFYPLFLYFFGKLIQNLELTYKFISYGNIIQTLQNVSSMTSARREKINKTILIVVTAFIISWLPNHVFR